MTYTNYDPRFGFNSHPYMPQQHYVPIRQKKAHPIKAILWWGVGGFVLFAALAIGTQHVDPNPQAAKSRLSHYQRAGGAALSVMREDQAVAQTMAPTTEQTQPPPSESATPPDNVVVQAASPTTQTPKTEAPKAQTVVLGGHDLQCAPKQGVDIAKFWADYKKGDKPEWTGNEYEPYVKEQVCA